jgi:hypothetical protein
LMYLHVLGILLIMSSAQSIEPKKSAISKGVAWRR